MQPVSLYSVAVIAAINVPQLTGIEQLQRHNIHLGTARRGCLLLVKLPPSTMSN